MIKRSKFSLSHYKLLSARMGYLIPIQLTEVLPGDTFQMATSLFIRLAPMVAPVMHPVHVRVHHWYVPTRLIWKDFEDFITGGADGLNMSEPPYIVTSDVSQLPVGGLPDYLGVPPNVSGLKFSALPFRAYSLIYNEWYRDQDLEEPLPVAMTSGLDSGSYPLQRVDWERDYFTTARPWPQKGPAVSVPVNLTAAGEPTITAQTTITGNGAPVFQAGDYSQYASALRRETNGLQVYQGEQINADGDLRWLNPALAATTNINFTSGNPELGSVDINQLREAFALQRFEEHRALYGSRYTEYLRFLGIKASDARLQRPEYLGGGKQTIQFSEVLQTAPSDGSPVGAMAGHGVGAMRTNRFRRFFEEHGFVISLMTVQPVAVYQQGLPRMWQRQVKEDYFQRELQHIGQQEVWQSELYATGDNAGNTAESDRATHMFGYQNRYDEYRWHESSVAGEFRKLLNYWHMAREFDTPPVLNAAFISGLPTNRIFAAQENDQLYVMASHSIQARRAMAKFGNPI